MVKEFLEKVFKFTDYNASIPGNAYPTYDPNTNPMLFPPKSPTEDPLLDVMNATGQNPSKPPLSQNFFVHTSAIGSQGTEIYAGYAREEYLRELLGHDRAKIFDRMRRSDTQVKMLLNAVKNPIKQATWDIQPASDMQNDIDDANFIKHLLFERFNFNKFLANCLTMVDFGHAVAEPTVKLVKDDPRWGTFHAINAIDFISQKTIYRWNLNTDTGDLVSLTQIAIGDLHRYVDIPAELLMCFSIEQEGANYEGVSMLRPCYGNWFRKNLYLKLNAIGIEKFAIPTPVVTIPTNGFQGTAQYSFLIQALEVYTSGQSNYLTIPDGVKIDWVKGVYDPAKVDAAVDSEDRRMTKAFLANFLELGANGRGSFALSEDLSDFFLSGLEHVAQEVCDKVNTHLIPMLMNMNRPGRGKLPLLKHSGITDKAGKEMADTMVALAGAKIIIPDDPLEDNVRKRFNWPGRSQQGQRQDQAAPPSGGGGASSPGGGGGKSLSERILKRVYG